MDESFVAQTWIEFNAGCQAAVSKEALSTVLVQTFGKLGYDHVNISILRDYDLPQDELKFGWASNYPDDWVTYYVERGCYRFDPVAQLAMGDIDPFFWSELKTLMNLTTVQNNFLGLASEAGLNNGVGLPFFGPRSLCGGVALATSSPNAECLRDLNVLWSIANLFYRRLRQLLIPPKLIVGQPVELTTRQIEVLSLSAAGHRDRGIADKLKITEDTVNSHLREIFRKFDAHTRLQAFAMAVKGKLIDLP